MAHALLLWLAGWLAGSMVNLLADQLPIQRRISLPVCAACGRPTGWLEYFFLESCPGCGQARSLRCQMVQWAYPLFFVAVNFWKPERLLTWEGLALTIFFGLVLVIDMEQRLILHPVSLAGAVLATWIGLRMHGPWNTLLGGVAGFAIMLALYWLGDLFARFVAWRRGQAIDEVALGFGDVNLAGILGLLLGWPGVTAGLLGAILVGGVTSAVVMGVMMARKQYQAFTALPYAPFLILAAVVLLLRP